MQLCFHNFLNYNLNSKDQNKIGPDFFPCVLNFSAKKKKKNNVLAKCYDFKHYSFPISITKLAKKTVLLMLASMWKTTVKISK